VRDPNKCILCGDCVRVCTEIQGIGALDFSGRGSNAQVGPAFGKNLEEVECVACGQCARVCPTGAITPRKHVNEVWDAIHDPEVKVVAQVAPAVRVALGECFGELPGANTMGRIPAALRAMGFDAVYDTSFTADLTVIEEAEEFLGRLERGENMPQFTSCCPAWVDLMERSYNDLLPNVSTCKSPQQMFGALAKKYLPNELGAPAEKICVVAIMPCTAKKREAGLEKFRNGGAADVDHVLTTQELAQMIKEAGLDFSRLPNDSLDMPFGFKTGAGLIFGTTGGVTEAVLRYVSERVTGEKPGRIAFEGVRGNEGIREASITLNGRDVKVGIVHGLANAQQVLDDLRNGECPYDFIEVMACPGGCVGGAGQPVVKCAQDRGKRAQGLYAGDKQLHFHNAQENPFIREFYEHTLGGVGSEKAHALLHTHYRARRRMASEHMNLHAGEHYDKVRVTVCVGTSCHVRGSQKLLSGLTAFVGREGLDEHVDVRAAFCTERCDRGPTVEIGDRVLEKCTLEQAEAAIREDVAAIRDCYEVKTEDFPYPTVADFERQTVAGLARYLQTRAAEKKPCKESCHGHECTHTGAGAGRIHE
jgi:NADH-quinone oxidoreductase subunit G